MSAEPSDEVVENIERCLDAQADLDRLRDELHPLRLSSDPRAQFAVALFDLERARRGDPEARTAMLEIADALLVFWRDDTGAELSHAHPGLEALWAGAASLLVGFEVKRFERGLKACWEARGDPVLLVVAIEHLQPEGNRRVEFARCLFHLVLARAMVEESRAEFARRAPLIAEAYNNETIAQQLIGGDAGLARLWEDLHPYLDDFFAAMEDAAAPPASAPSGIALFPRDEVATDPAGQAYTPLGGTPEVPSFRTLMERRAQRPASGEFDAVEVEVDDGPPAAPPPAPSDLTPPGQWLVPPGVRDGEDAETELIDISEDAPPPAPSDLTPPGAWLPPPELRGPAPTSDDIEIIEAEEGGGPPPPPALTPAHGLPAAAGAPTGGSLDVSMEDDWTPTREVQLFWAHTARSLDLMPDPRRPRLARRLLGVDAAEDRKRLNDYIASLGPHANVPQARAFACLIKLSMAGQMKERTLFGQPSARRAEAFADAFSLLGTDARSVAHAAVWFVLDGQETDDALQKGLTGLVDYLAFCVRTQKDPEVEATRSAWVASLRAS